MISDNSCFRKIWEELDRVMTRPLMLEFLFGRDAGIWTPDPLNPIQVRFQTAPRPAILALKYYTTQSPCQDISLWIYPLQKGQNPWLRLRYQPDRMGFCNFSKTTGVGVGGSHKGALSKQICNSLGSGRIVPVTFNLGQALNIRPHSQQGL